MLNELLQMFVFIFMNIYAVTPVLTGTEWFQQSNHMGTYTLLGTYIVANS
jgi:hypothetical protein